MIGCIFHETSTLINRHVGSPSVTLNKVYVSEFKPFVRQVSRGFRKNSIWKCLKVCIEWKWNITFIVVGMHKKASNCEPFVTRVPWTSVYYLIVDRQFSLFIVGAVGGSQNKCIRRIFSSLSLPFPFPWKKKKTPDHRLGKTLWQTHEHETQEDQVRMVLS